MATIEYDDLITQKRPGFTERLRAYWAARRLVRAARKQKRLERMFLSQLSEHLLLDIGLNPADVREAHDLPVMFYPIRRRDHQ